MNYIVVGDMHVREQDLKECTRLSLKIRDLAIKYKADAIVFMGDQTHTHNVVHGTVLNFWKQVLIGLSEICPVIFIIGNHDFGNDINTSSLLLFKNLKNVHVIDRPIVIDDCLFMPFYRNKDKFIKDCEKYSNDLMFCHETFAGAKYENNFYDPNGIDLNRISQKTIISGHIHLMQEVGKCFYVGSPRWISLSDANVEKFIWLMEFKDNKLINKTPFNTEDVCVSIKHYKDSPGEPLVFLDDNSQWKPKVTVDVHGPVDYVKERTKEFERAGFRVRAFPTKNFKSSVKESEGIRKAFVDFISSYKSVNGTPPETLLNLAMDRIRWMTQ